MKRKILLFGGSFDPVHKGHITVAGQASEHIVSDEVFFIPAGQSPHKECLPFAGTDDRIKMLSLAISGRKGFKVSTCELERSGPSYTLDTILRFRADYGEDAELYWLIGADCIGELPGWYGIIDVIDKCNLCVMYRGGYARPEFEKFVGLFGSERVKKLSRNVIPVTLIDMSSTEIREGIAAGLDMSDKLDVSVAEYIRQRGLYRK